MRLKLESINVQSYTTGTIQPQEPVETINTGEGGKYTLCYICPGPVTTTQSA